MHRVALLVIVLTGGQAMAQDMIEAGVNANGKFELTGPIAESNNFSDDFFWETSSGDIGRSGFDDGDLQPFDQWPRNEVLNDGNWANIQPQTHQGRDAGRFWWSSDAYYDYWGDRDNTRLGQGVELDGPVTTRKEFWYDFDLNVPSAPTFPNDKEQGIAQIFQMTDGPRADSFAGMLVIDDNDLVMRHRYNRTSPETQTMIVEDLPRDTWKDVTIHTVASGEGNGPVEVWYSGEQVYDASDISFGFGKRNADDRFVDGSYQFLKLGLYAYDSGNYDANETRKLYFDNITEYDVSASNMNLRIEAENFKSGGEDVAYHDLDSANKEGAYRPSEGVDLQRASDTTFITDWNKAGEWFNYKTTSNEAGEWLKYKLVIPEDSPYQTLFRVASGDSGGVIQLELNGEDLTGDIDLPSTGDYESWTTFEGPLVNLPAGEHTLRLNVENGEYHMNWMEFELVPEPTSLALLLAPTTLLLGRRRMRN
jgi:hypothetical protein